MIPPRVRKQGHILRSIDHILTLTSSTAPCETVADGIQFLQHIRGVSSGSLLVIICNALRILRLLPTSELHYSRHELAQNYLYEAELGESDLYYSITLVLMEHDVYTRTQIYHWKAISEYSGGMYLNALHWISEVLVLADKSLKIECLFLRAKCYFKLSNWVEACALFMAIQTETESISVHVSCEWFIILCLHRLTFYDSLLMRSVIILRSNDLQKQHFLRIIGVDALVELTALTLDIIAKYHSLLVLHTLLPQYNPRYIDAKGRSLIWFATKWLNLRMINTLLRDKAVDVFAEDENHESAFTLSLVLQEERLTRRYLRRALLLIPSLDDCRETASYRQILRIIIRGTSFKSLFTYLPFLVLTGISIKGAQRCLLEISS